MQCMQKITFIDRIHVHVDRYMVLFLSHIWSWNAMSIMHAGRQADRQTGSHI